MRVEGWLTDVALRGDEAILWIRDPSGGRIRLTDRYHPDFYAEPRGVEPWELKSLLEEHPKIRGITVETRVSSISRDGEKTVARSGSAGSRTSARSRIRSRRSPSSPGSTTSTYPTSSGT